MKPKNFPARKLARQIRAQKRVIGAEERLALDAARAIRTKKNRSGRGDA